MSHVPTKPTIVQLLVSMLMCCKINVCVHRFLGHLCMQSQATVLYESLNIVFCSLAHVRYVLQTLGSSYHVTCSNGKFEPYAGSA